MAFFAERLPVCLIPEQLLISPVRNNVIHDCCRDELSLCLTECAKRMLFQEDGPCFLPAAIISPGSCAAAQTVTAPLHMNLTINLPLYSKLRASRIPAGSSGFIRHGCFLLQNEKTPVVIDRGSCVCVL